MIFSSQSNRRHENQLNNNIRRNGNVEYDYGYFVRLIKQSLPNWISRRIFGRYDDNETSSKRKRSADDDALLPIDAYNDYEVQEVLEIEKELQEDLELQGNLMNHRVSKRSEHNENNSKSKRQIPETSSTTSTPAYNNSRYGIHSNFNTSSKAKGPEGKALLRRELEEHFQGYSTMCDFDYAINESWLQHCEPESHSQQGEVDYEGEPRNTKILDPDQIVRRLMRPLYFSLELAELDILADKTSILAISGILFFLSRLHSSEAFESRSIAQPGDIWQILESLLIMFVARTGASRILRGLFAHKERELYVLATAWVHKRYGESFGPRPRRLSVLDDMIQTPSEFRFSKERTRNMVSTVGQTFIFYMCVCLICILNCIQMRYKPIRYGFCT
eukprot:g78.t1